MGSLLMSQILVMATTSLIVVALYVQAFKLWSTKSVDDFHPAIVIALPLNELAWLNYGIRLLEWPIIAIPIISIPAAGMIAIGYFKFRIQKKEAEGD
jgi:uncharacterized protein with PQ loop repeat